METKLVVDLPIGDFVKIAHIFHDTRHVFLPPFFHAGSVEIHMGEQPDGIQKLSIRRLKRTRNIRRRTSRHGSD